MLFILKIFLISSLIGKTFSPHLIIDWETNYQNNIFPITKTTQKPIIDNNLEEETIKNKEEQDKKLKEAQEKFHSTLKNTKKPLFYYGFKDDMFKYHNGTWFHDDGYMYVDYNQKRDLEDRDFIDVDQAYPEWVDLSLKDKETYHILNYDNMKVDYYKISGGDKFLIIFIHWLNWNATRWFKDWTFNWNFNRLKHIAYYNWWTYISPTIKNFNKGSYSMAEYIKGFKEKNPNAKIFVACWSSWGETCWRLYWMDSVPLDWLLLLGSMPPFWWFTTLKNRWIPIYYWHGGKDKAMGVGWSIWTYKRLKNDWYKIKLEIFTNWVHWTPLRMVNYLSVLRWMVNEENIKGEDKSIWLPPPQKVPEKVKETFPSLSE